MGTLWTDGYTAAVAIHLDVNGAFLRVSRVGPGSLALRDTPSIAPGTPARLVVEIDGREIVHNVVLFAGATGGPQPILFF
jgi:hypothetical protein